ncbi:MAG: caspase family protein, partial [Syntrophaceae bacterium]|nr:caspase family protein [Syntrophaceae bacterium]
MAKGFALTIGLNAVNPKHYGGWSGELNACEADAEDMA